MARAAVIGTGGWGKNHLRVLKELGALSALCDIDSVRREEYVERYDVRGYPSVSELLSSERLDLALVCVPTRLHYEVAERCVDAGVDTFIEKPMVPTEEEGRKLLTRARRRGVRIGVGYIERFNPAVNELRTILREKKLGEALLLEFHRENRLPPITMDVGIILDTSVHDIDTSRWLLGEEPQMVFARTGTVSGRYEDFAAITLGFEGKKTAFIASNWVTPMRVRQLVAVCTEGVVTLDFITQQIQIDDARSTAIPRRQWEEPLKLELMDLVESVEKGRDPLVTGEDALLTTRVAEAALLSSRTGAPQRLG